MEIRESFNVEVNTNKQVLSSETKIYKTERFFYQTKKLAGIDRFVLKIAENLLSLSKTICEKYKNREDVNCFKIDVFDKNYSFLIKFGFQLQDAAIADEDIVFFDLQSEFDDLKMNDQRVVQYLKEHRIFSVILKPIVFEEEQSDFKKLYLL